MFLDLESKSGRFVIGLAFFAFNSFSEFVLASLACHDLVFNKTQNEEGEEKNKDHGSDESFVTFIHF